MSKLTSQKREKFCNALRQGDSVYSAAEQISVSRQALYQYRKNHEDFAAQWDDAVEAGTDSLEDEAIRRAKEGSDTLLIFMLKGRRPERFKDRHEHSGPKGESLFSGLVEALDKASE